MRVHSPRGLESEFSHLVAVALWVHSQSEAALWVPRIGKQAAESSCGSQREPTVQWSASGEPTVKEIEICKHKVNYKLWAQCEVKCMVLTQCAVLLLGNPVAGLAVQLVWKKLWTHCEVGYKNLLRREVQIVNTIRSDMRSVNLL